MTLVAIHRYPVKSFLGEQLERAEVDARGLVGDRLWAVVDGAGKLGSGKSTRRFRRMEGLLQLRATLSGTAVPTVELPDGARFAADDPAAEAAVSAALGLPVTLAREGAVQHHDDGPVSIVSTAALRRLGEVLGSPVDARRFRANLLVDLPGTGFPEDAWVGHDVRVGPDVVLRPIERLTRCVMIGMAQADLPEDPRMLATVERVNDLTCGIWCDVLRPGTVTVGDPVAVG